MNATRRNFMATTAAFAGIVTMQPLNARAGGHLANEFKSAAGTITVHPINHASLVLETPVGTIIVDPTADPTAYAAHPDADLVLVTHEHGDHFNNDVLTALVKPDTALIANAGAAAKLTPELQAKAQVMANGDTLAFGEMKIDAVPAYNYTEGRTNFHPKGRDNGYVLTIADFRIYISGDTEDTPEMRALEDIDLAFLAMNQPFTMNVQQAASAIAAFKPTYVYPYHYRGRDDGAQDPAELAELLGDTAEVKFGAWY